MAYRSQYRRPNYPVFRPLPYQFAMPRWSAPTISSILAPFWERKRVRDARMPFALRLKATLETTQGQMDGFFSQLPNKCYLEEVTSVGD